MTPQAPDTLKLECGSLRLELAPHAGGSIAAFRIQRQDRLIDLMRPASEQALQNSDAGATSCFPLVPFSNRIENGEFEYGNQQVKLNLNFAPHPHALHGQGFQHPWQVSQYEQSSASIVYEHAGGDDGWPWIYRSTQNFTLTENSLITQIAIQNASQEPMPAGFGFHPFFPKTDGVELDINLAKVWLGDDNCLPQELIDIPEQWRLTHNRRLQGIVLDHCFTDWDGKAKIFWPEYQLGLEITHTGLLKHMVIYAPEGKNFFCVEPVSNINNAIRLAAKGVNNTGLFELAPNETVSAEVKYKIIS